MNTKVIFSIRLLSTILIISLFTQVFAVNPIPKSANEDLPKLQNPFTVQYLKKNLRKSQPRLVLNSKIEKNLKKKLKSDPVVQNVYKAIKLNADEIQNYHF